MRKFTILLILSIISCMAHSEEDAATEKKIEYLPLSPKFVVNLQGGRRSYLRADIQLMVEGSENLEAIKTHIPAIRHSLIMLFSDHTVDQLRSSAQRETLRQKALKQTQKTLEKYASNGKLKDIFFTEFLIQ